MKYKFRNIYRPVIIISSLLVTSCSYAPSIQATSFGKTCTFPQRWTVEISQKNGVTSYQSRILVTLQGLVGAKCTFEISEIHGYTDTKGTKADNYSLSQERALSVQQWLGSEGYFAGGAKIIPHGETDLFLKTEDGVAQPLNNRVEVVITGISIPNN